MRGRGFITSLVLETAANWNSITAKAITSVSWKLGDNLFIPAIMVFLAQFWDSSFRYVHVVALWEELSCLAKLFFEFFELSEGVRDSLHVSPAFTPPPCPCWKSTFSAPAKCLLCMCSWGVWPRVCIRHLSTKRGVCVRVCVSECARMFFSEHYHSAADLLLLSASTQMSGHCTFSEGSSGICKDKHWEQSTESNNVLWCLMDEKR